MAINKGLGKGLSALFSDTEEDFQQTESSPREAKEKVVEKIVAVSTGKPIDIPIFKIEPNPNQPRKKFNDENLNELADSIKQHGIIAPLVLMQQDERYVIIAGERRFRAAKIAGLDKVPAILKVLNEQQIQEIALIENLQREDLNPIEAATAIKELMTNYNLTQETVSSRIGVSRSAVANMLRLLSLPPEVVNLVRDNRLSAGHARCLITIENPSKQLDLAYAAADNKMSVRELEQAAKEGQKTSKAAPILVRAKGTPSGTREIKDLISQMERVFGTKVSFVGTENKGRINIDYYSSEDLERIFKVLEKLK